MNDNLLDQALAEADLATGVNPAIVAARSPGVQVSPTIQAQTSCATNQTPWTAAEEKFLAAKYGYYTDAEIAAALGRTESAVKIRRYRHLNIAGIGHGNPNFMTANQIAAALGIDGHSVVRLTDRNIMPTWLYSDREIRLARTVTVYRWAVNPLHWPYFIKSIRNPARIGDPHLRRLIQRQIQRWPDQWWTIGEVAEYHGVKAANVNAAIHRGQLQGIKWGNWFIRRSQALKPGLYFATGRRGHTVHDWSAQADIFLLIARALGVKYAAIAALMAWTDERRVRNRYEALKERGEIPALIHKYDLKIYFDPATGQVDTSWADYGHRFPRVRLTDTVASAGAASTR